MAFFKKGEVPEEKEREEEEEKGLQEIEDEITDGKDKETRIERRKGGKN